MKKYLFLFIALAVVSLNTALSLADVADYEVHEWGILAGCDATGDYLLTSRPLQIVVVKEPVLYFHSKDKKPFSLKVTFNQGVPTETYPEAEKEKNIVQWQDVSFVGDSFKASKGLWLGDDHVPLSEIIDTLNNVDADEIFYNGARSRFLFYEGEMPFRNKVQYTFDPVSQEATVINNNDYPILDFFIIHPESMDLPFQKRCLIGYLPRLQPNETGKVKLDLAMGKMDFAKSLINLGFTEKEAESFRSLWSSSIIEYGQMLYRLPDSECNRLITLEFAPEPKKIIRALYVLVKD